MANIKYFSDYNGETVELEWTESMKNADFAAIFPGVRGLRYDSFSKRVGFVRKNGLKVVYPLTRVIEYKKNPSLHECNAKCLGGKHNGSCECRCGGKNHGRGTLSIAAL